MTVTSQNVGQQATEDLFVVDHKDALLSHRRGRTIAGGVPSLKCEPRLAFPTISRRGTGNSCRAGGKTGPYAGRLHAASDVHPSTPPPRWCQVVPGGPPAPSLLHAAATCGLLW